MGVNLKNQLVKVLPERVVFPYGNIGTLSSNCVLSPSGAIIEHDLRKCDPTTGLPFAKITIPLGNTSYQSINYNSIPVISPAPDDVWMFSVYIDAEFVPESLIIQMLVSDKDSVSGLDYRYFSWSGKSLNRGYNILTCLNVENTIGSTEYGVVGTTGYAVKWINSGTMTDNSQAKSFKFRVKTSTALTNNIDIYFGALHRAPPNWCTSAIMWGADDVPKSFYDLAIPIFEEFGWCTTINVASSYAGSNSPTYMNINDVKVCFQNGHEVWNHTRKHDNLNTITTEEKYTSLIASRDYFAANGIASASRYLTYPFGAYDNETIAIAKYLGFKLGRTASVGGEISAWIPAINPFNINAFSADLANSWKVDSHLEGVIKRGNSSIVYTHNVYPGGNGVHTQPALYSVYADHIRRWCELVKAKELQGKVVCTTISDFYYLCGVVPQVDYFAE